MSARPKSSTSTSKTAKRYAAPATTSANMMNFGHTYPIYVPTEARYLDSPYAPRSFECTHPNAAYTGTSDDFYQRCYEPGQPLYYPTACDYAPRQQHSYHGTDAEWSDFSPLMWSKPDGRIGMGDYVRDGLHSVGNTAAYALAANTAVGIGIGGYNYFHPAT